MDAGERKMFIRNLSSMYTCAITRNYVLQGFIDNVLIHLFHSILT